MSGYLLHQQQKGIDLLIDILQMNHGTSLTSLDAGQYSLIVQWGAEEFKHGDISVPVLNTAQGIQYATHEKKLSFLQLNGIATATQSQSFIRLYYVVLFQDQIISIYRSSRKNIWFNEDQFKNKKQFIHIPVNHPGGEIRRIKKISMRTIYALGLDFGGVFVGILPGDKCKVMDIHVTPFMTRESLLKFKQCIEEFRKRYYKEDNQVLLGADPEFVLRNPQGKMVLASKFFQKHGKVGYDAVSMRGDNSRNRHPLAELRPDPSNNPRQLTINLYRTMLLGIRKINNPSIEWLAGGLPYKGYPIGGHIHFSGIPFTFQLLRALDNYLTLPLILNEDPRGTARRPRYGYLGDFRQQFHGGFEYRTPPSWLISPRITKGVFALSKVIVSSYRQLKYYPLMYMDTQEAYYKGDKKNLLPVVQNLWNQLEQLPIYQSYEQYLNPFRDLIFSLRTWDETRDIRPNWQLPPFAK
ncbi:hypothetical protein L1765_03875 [Microaerobacter geothermalis]|uniref:putative amidoligase domain-containing protein n=1 Tax=Microaerobacter geothermalis TaxID=674972 RepID=UPI001F2871DD|nr:hypothetical protein [Microaerobacter geothermalis]MCF6093133.1 hypothetical protein [Microaerobacter geothermalis]